MIKKPDLKLSDVKQAKRKTTSCKYIPNIECCIKETIEKYFMRGGNVEGCAGCCKNCLKKDECEHSCVVVRANRADLKDQMRFEDMKEEPRYFSKKEIEELTFTFQDVKKVLGKYAYELNHMDRKKKEEMAREYKIVSESLQRLLKEMVVVHHGE